jgi:hypothetical protein
VTMSRYSRSAGCRGLSSAWSATFVAVVAACGCGPGANHATVTGRVTLQGKPVANAFIVLVADDGRATQPSAIQPGGFYRIDRVPPGRVMVSIDDVSSAIAMLPGRQQGPAVGGAIDPELALTRAKLNEGAQAPARFKDPAQSGLILNLQPGLNPGCDLDLK